MNKINDEIKNLVKNKFFTVKFYKKDGSLRTMNARLGVKKHLKGGKQTYNPDSFNYLIVFDIKKGGYRTINVNTITEILFKGSKYLFNEGKYITKNDWSKFNGDFK